MSGPAKIYDRPERPRPSPVIIIIIAIVVLIAGFFLVKAFYHPAGSAPRSGAARAILENAFGNEVHANGENKLSSRYG
jgi:hypothetical protein